MADQRDLPPFSKFTFPPGSAVLIGPRGKMTLHTGRNPEDDLYGYITGATFIGTDNMSEEHTAFLNRMWLEQWCEHGQIIMPTKKRFI